VHQKPTVGEQIVKDEIEAKRQQRLKDANAQRQREFLDRQAKKGLIKVIVWVQPKNALTVKSFAESL
tara:strand:- start:699 stop:899 length:201 start_codon:yes stop_codon:yes gene_type:complete